VLALNTDYVVRTGAFDPKVNITQHFYTKYSATLHSAIVHKRTGILYYPEKLN